MKANPAPLFRRDFTLVVIGQIISLFGSAILRFALPLYLLRRTGSPALFGAVGAASFIPAVLCSPIGGVAADRVNKRTIMAVLDFSTAGLILLFALLLGRAPLVPLTAACLMLLYGIAGAYQPAVQASIPLLTAADRLTSANAVINMVQTLSGLLGPVAGGVLFGVFGLRPILWVGAGCFFLSAVMELFIHIPHRPRAAEGNVLSTVRRDLGECWRFIRRERPVFLSAMLVLALFNLVLSAALIVGIPVAVVQVLNMSDSRLGLTQGAMGLGGLSGGILAACLGERLQLRRGGGLLRAGIPRVGRRRTRRPLSSTGDIKPEGLLKPLLGIALHIGPVRPVGRQQPLRLRRQHRAAAVPAAGGGVQHSASKHLLGGADNAPGLGVGHLHGGGRGPQGVVLPHPLQQRGDARAETAPVVVGVKADCQLQMQFPVHRLLRSFPPALRRCAGQIFFILSHFRWFANT